MHLLQVIKRMWPVHCGHMVCHREECTLFEPRSDTIKTRTPDIATSAGQHLRVLSPDLCTSDVSGKRHSSSIKPGETQTEAKTCRPSGKSGQRVESVKRYVKRTKAGIVGKIFFPLLAMLMHLPYACAEESSIMEGATVTDYFMDTDSIVRPGSNLISKGFKNSVVFSSDDPVGNGSAVFQIKLK